MFGKTVGKALTPKQRAQNINKIRASRDASENALFFGNTRSGQDAWDIARGKTKTRGRTPEEQKQLAGDRVRAQQVVKNNKDYMDTVKQQLRDPANGPALSKEQKDVIRAEARQKAYDMQDAQAFLKADNDGAFKGGIQYGMMDRAKAAGSAVGQYYFGGTGRQMAARIGGTAGGIVGLNVGLDALENMNFSSSSGGQTY